MPTLEYILIQCAQQEDSTGRDQVRVTIDGQWIADTYIDTNENKYVYTDHAGGTISVNAGSVIEFSEVDIDSNDVLGSAVISQADIDSAVKDLSDSISSAKYGFHLKFGHDLSDSNQ